MYRQRSIDHRLAPPDIIEMTDRTAGVSIRGIFENELFVIRPVGRFPAHCLGVLPRAGFLRIAISAESVRRVRSASGKARRSDILLLRRTESRSLFRRTSCGVLQRTGSLYGENQRSEGSLGGQSWPAKRGSQTLRFHKARSSANLAKWTRLSSPCPLQHARDPPRNKRLSEDISVPKGEVVC